MFLICTLLICLERYEAHYGLPLGCKKAAKEVRMDIRINLSFVLHYLITSNINQDCNLGLGAGIPSGNCKRESLSCLDKPPSCFPLHHLGPCLLI